jgi:hypothetical protein
METTVNEFNTRPTGKMYGSPDDLAALINDDVEAAEPVNIFDMPFADRFKVVDSSPANDSAEREAQVQVDNAERISAGHVEASFTPPNVTFKEDLRNDNLKEIIDAARKALDDAFEADQTCSQIEDC